MLALSYEQSQALQQRRVVRRLFLTIEAITDDSPMSDATARFWDDVGEKTINGQIYYGSGNVIEIQSLSNVADSTIPGLTITLSGIPNDVNNLIRGTRYAQRPVSLDVGLFDPDTREIIGNLLPRFRGFINQVQINTPEAGGASTIVVTCESASAALTIGRTDTRSNASAKERDSTDLFYRYTDVQREKPVYFGMKRPRSGGVQSHQPKKKKRKGK